MQPPRCPCALTRWGNDFRVRLVKEQMLAIAIRLGYQHLIVIDLCLSDRWHVDFIGTQVRRSATCRARERRSGSSVCP